jgi:hypothetical protein
MDDRDGSPRTRRPERAWIIIAVVLLGALGMILLGAIMANERRQDVWVELVSRASQLVVLALAGGVVGAVIHDRDAAREDERRRQAFLLGFVDEVEAAYGQVKTARRLLRTFGFDTPRPARLTPEQVTGYRTQLALLNEAELQFETLARRVMAVPRPFGDAGDRIAAELAAIHGYLNSILRDWQSDPGAVVEGGTTMSLDHRATFGPFVGYGDAAEAAFRAGVTAHVEAVELFVHGLGATH